MAYRYEFLERYESDLRTLRSVVDGLWAHGGRPALVSVGEEGVEIWTYGELAGWVRRLAGGLHGAGVGRGEHVALLATNSKEWVAACLAVISAGAVVVPLDAQLGDDSLCYALEDSGARHVFTTADQAERLENVDTGAALRTILLDAREDDERSWRWLLAEENRGSARPGKQGAAILTSGFRQLLDTLCAARAHPQTLLFLGAYLLYNDGIQTVVTLTAVYAKGELGLGTGTIISAVLMVQFLAFIGALVLGACARFFGAKRVVLADLILWTGAVAGASFLHAGAVWQFYLLAAFIGAVLGGSQALSRSLFSHMIPGGQEAAYFGLYEIGERGTSWLGLMLFGLTLQLTTSYRRALASLVVFFALGFALLARCWRNEFVPEAPGALTPWHCDDTMVRLAASTTLV
jgi:acyl-CoA synthetase (AMP-forming)/AMP-acid ligase II